MLTGASLDIRASGKAFALVEDLVDKSNRERQPNAPVAKFTHHEGVRPVVIPFKGVHHDLLMRELNQPDSRNL